MRSRRLAAKDWPTDTDSTKLTKEISKAGTHKAWARAHGAAHPSIDPPGSVSGGKPCGTVPTTRTPCSANCQAAEKAMLKSSTATGAALAARSAAPPPPTAEEWAFAAQYTNKNSKGYRYSWGQQVRSMMGTAVEGPDQGVVRFRIEIAPDGSLTQLQTLWTTSAKAEKLARQAIENMSPLPPTPTGKPLIFDKTISFSPFANDGPPIYRDDCLPELPVFRNPFAWEGKSPQVVAAPTPAAPLDPQALADCLRQLPKDSVEAETARDQRLMDQWGSSKTGR
jgi:TonB family protein